MYCTSQLQKVTPFQLINIPGVLPRYNSTYYLTCFPLLPFLWLNTNIGMLFIQVPYLNPPFYLYIIQLPPITSYFPTIFTHLLSTYHAAFFLQPIFQKKVAILTVYKLFSQNFVMYLRYVWLGQVYTIYPKANKQNCNAEKKKEQKTGNDKESVFNFVRLHYNFHFTIAGMF